MLDWIREISVLINHHVLVILFASWGQAASGWWIFCYLLLYLKRFEVLFSPIWFCLMNIQTLVFVNEVFVLWNWAGNKKNSECFYSQFWCLHHYLVLWRRRVIVMSLYWLLRPQQKVHAWMVWNWKSVTTWVCPIVLPWTARQSLQHLMKERLV